MECPGGENRSCGENLLSILPDENPLNELALNGTSVGLFLLGLGNFATAICRRVKRKFPELLQHVNRMIRTAVC
jgi:hypothetical protein